MAPEAMLKVIPCAAGSSITQNSTQRSGAVAPQQVSCLTTTGLIHEPLGFPVRLTVKLGVVGPHVCENPSAEIKTKRKEKNNMRIDFANKKKLRFYKSKKEKMNMKN